MGGPSECSRANFRNSRHPPPRSTPSKNKNGQRLLISAAALPGSPLSDRGHRCKFLAKVQPELSDLPIVVSLISKHNLTTDGLTSSLFCLFSGVPDSSPVPSPRGRGRSGYRFDADQQGPGSFAVLGSARTARGGNPTAGSREPTSIPGIEFPSRSDARSRSEPPSIRPARLLPVPERPRLTPASDSRRP